MRTFLRWIGRLLLALLVLVVGFVIYGRWAWGDLPVAVLEQRYAPPELQRARVSGVEMAYTLNGEGPLVVLIHSHFLEMGMWDAWLPALTPHFRVLRYDLSGHGLTGPDPSGVYRVTRDAELLAGLLDTVAPGEPAALVGSSLGGNIAFTLAATQQERVSALVLINSGGLKRDNSRAGGEIPGWVDAVFPLIPPALLRRFLRWMVADPTVINRAAEDRFVDFWRREGNRRAELGRLRQYETGDPAPLLAAITAPSLILWGEDNPQLPVALAERFEHSLVNAASVERRVFAGAGHLLPVEQPIASVEATRAFLVSLETGVLE